MAEVTYRVEATAGGTRFTIHDVARRKRLMKLLAPLLNRIDIYYRKKQMRIIEEELAGP